MNDKYPKFKHSKIDDRGFKFIACYECTIGGNGDHSCWRGGKSTEWDNMSCRQGTLLPLDTADEAR